MGTKSRSMYIQINLYHVQPAKYLVLTMYLSAEYAPKELATCEIRCMEQSYARKK